MEKWEGLDIDTSDIVTFLRRWNYNTNVIPRSTGNFQVVILNRNLEDPFNIQEFLNRIGDESHQWSYKEMTKEAHYHSHHEKSSQQSSEDLTNDLIDLTKGRNEQKPEHLMFFLLVFLRIKQVVNKLGSL